MIYLFRDVFIFLIVEGYELGGYTLNLIQVVMTPRHPSHSFNFLSRYILQYVPVIDPY